MTCFREDLDPVQRPAGFPRRRLCLLCQHRDRLVHDEGADATWQAGNKHAFAVHQIAYQRELACRDGTIDPAHPELPDVEMFACIVTQRVGDRGRQDRGRRDQVMNLLHAEDRQRMVERINFSGKAEIDVIDDTQQTFREYFLNDEESRTYALRRQQPTDPGR